MDKSWKLLLFREGVYVKGFSADNTWCKVVKKKVFVCLFCVLIVIPPFCLLVLQVPHQVAGGEESVSAVQHACFATGPAGRRHGHRWAHTAAPPGDRERGVADEDPHPAQPRPAPPRPLFFFYTTVTSTHLSSSHLCRYWLVDSVDRQQEKENAQIFTTTTTTTNYAFVPLCSSHCVTRKGWPDLTSGWWMTVLRFYFSGTMKKSWWRRSFSPWPSCSHRLFHNQSTFFLEAPANDQEEKKKKKAKNYNKYEYNFFTSTLWKV